MAAARGARALGKLDPADPALDEQTFAGWLRAHGQSENAIEALWNLIALPTLNLPAQEASLAAAVKVFRTGLLDAADASDIGIPTVPFRLLHAEPAAAALEALGRNRAHLAPRSGAVDRRRTHRSRRRLGRGRRGDPRRPARSGRRRSPRTAPWTSSALDGLGTSPIVNLHVHYDRQVLDEPLAAALGSPVQWVFDRTQASGADEGQLVAISLSHAVDEIGASVAELRERYLPAIERLLPAARGAPGARFRRHARAARDLPRRARDGAAAPRPAHGRARLYLAGSWTDTGWPATMESAVRSGARGSAPRARRSRPDGARGAGRVTVTADRQIDAARGKPRARDPSTCSPCSSPTAGGRASSRPT